MSLVHEGHRCVSGDMGAIIVQVGDTDQHDSRLTFGHGLEAPALDHNADISNFNY